MDIGQPQRIVKVEPEPFPLGNPWAAPEEPNPMAEPVLVPTPEREGVPA